jgi:hypothetical protein
MAEFIGKQVQFGVAVESTRGTAEATAMKWFRQISCTIVERAAHAKDESTRGRLEEGLGRRVVQKWVEGDFEGYLHADDVGYLLASLYGKVTTTVVTGSVKSHLFELAQNITHPTLTLFVHDGVESKTFAGGVVTSLEISVAQEEMLHVKGSFVAGAAGASSDTPTYGTEYDFIARDVTVKVAATEAGLAAATALKLKDLTIKWDAGAQRDHVIGSYDPDDTYNTKLAIEGDFTRNFGDTDFKDMFLGDTAKYMSIAIVGAAEIATGHNPSVTVVLNRVQVTDWNKAGGASELVTEPVKFEATLNQTDVEQSTVTLKNLTAVYSDVPSV